MRCRPRWRGWRRSTTRRARSASAGARPDDRVGVGAEPAGTFTPSDAKAARNAVTSRRSRRRSSTTCCPGSSFTISVVRSGTTGPSHSSAAQHDDRRERVEQPTTDLTVGQIGAHEHHVAAVGAVAPGAHTEVHGVDQALPVERAAVPPGSITMVGSASGRCATTYGSGPPRSRRHRPPARPDRTESRARSHAAPCVIATTRAAHRP